MIPSRISTVLIVLRLLCLFIFLQACPAPAEQDPVETFGQYWRQVQDQRTSYQSQVSQIQKEYPDFESNPEAQQKLQEARNSFEATRSQTSASPEFKEVANNPEVQKQYWSSRQETYEKSNSDAKARLDARLDDIRNRYPDASQNALARKEIQQATNEYYDQSRNLAATHQKDVQDMLRDELTKRSDTGKGQTSAPIKDTAGSGYYQKDPKTGAIITDAKGNPVINPKHRGAAGDTDLEAGARTADAQSIRKILDEKGLTDVKVHDYPGYVSIGEGEQNINLTINKSGRDTGNAGDSSRQVQIDVDAASKETYVSIKMGENQPGRTYVAVQDHKKKALPGLTSPPGELLNRPEALQSMAKGASKAMEDTKLTNADLRKIIEDNKLRETPQSLRAKLSKLKEGQAIAPDGVGLNDKNIASYQKASRDILAAAEQKAQAQKDAEIRTTKQTIADLEKSNKPGDREKATALRKELVDSNMRINATEQANLDKEKKLAKNQGIDPDADAKTAKAEVKTRPPVDDKDGKKTAAKSGDEPGKTATGKSSGQSDKEAAGKSKGSGTTAAAGDGEGKDGQTSQKGRTTSAYGSKSESGIITKTTEERSGKTTVQRDGTKTSTSRVTTTQKGPTSTTVTETKTTTVATPDGKQQGTSTTTHDSKGLTSSESSTSTTRTTGTQEGGKESTTTTTSESRNPLTTTRTTGSSTTTQDKDGYRNTQGQETSTTKVGGVNVSQESDTTAKGWSNKSGSADAEGSYTKTTTKIGDTGVGETHTVKGGVTGTFGEDDDRPAKQPSNVSIKIADTIQVDEKGTTIDQGGGATKLGEHGEAGGGYKVEIGNTKHTQGTTITMDPSGNVKVEYTNQYEANLVKVTAGGKVAGKAAGVGVAVETKGEFTYGGRAGFKTNIEAGPDGIKSTGEVDIFIGMQAEGELSGTIDLKDHIGVSVKGTLKGTVSFGAGAKAGYEAELSWTKVKVSSQLAVTLGLGAGGQGTVEIDISKLTTNVDLEAVAQQDRESKITSDMIKSVKIGQYKLPPGKTWQDILPEMRKKLEWLAKHPEVLGKDQKAHEELMKSLKFEKGKGQQRFISVRKKQQDWYCTNKPTISSPASMSEMINQEIDRKNTMRKAFGMPPIEPWED